MRNRHSRLKRRIALWVVFLLFLTTAGPLDVLRSISFRWKISPQPAFAQENGVTVELGEGLNLFSVPVTVSSTTDTCYELLSILGGMVAVQSISRFNTATQLFEVCGFSGSTAVGENFPIREGEGYQVRMQTSRWGGYCGATPTSRTVDSLLSMTPRAR
jgi:hypothetical protein